jgi:type IV secretory pathway VirB2 component (pilin)
MDDQGERRRRMWRRVGIGVGITLAVVGVLAVGAMILFAVAMNSWANNK